MSTTRAVALLRAINVGGHMVRMERLRALFAELAFGNVETLIASGNVLFDLKRATPSGAERRIEAHLFAALGYEVATMVRSGEEIAAVLAGVPGTAAEGGVAGETEDATLPIMVGFLKSAPGSEAAAKLARLETATDSLRLEGRVVYWTRRDRISDSKLAGGLLEKTLGVPMTMRNVNTVRKIAAKLASSSLAFLLAVSLASCAVPFQRRPAEGVRTGLDSPGRRSAAGLQGRTDSTALSSFASKMVTAKQPPSTVRAADGTYCTLGDKQFAEMAQGDRLWCGWRK